MMSDEGQTRSSVAPSMLVRLAAHFGHPGDCPHSKPLWMTAFERNPDVLGIGLGRQILTLFGHPLPHRSDAAMLVGERILQPALRASRRWQISFSPTIGPFLSFW